MRSPAPGKEHLHMLGADQLESSLSEKGLDGCGGHQLNISQWCDLVAKANILMGCIKQSTITSSMEVIPHLIQHWRGCSWSTVSSSGLTSAKNPWTYWAESSEEMWRWLRDWTISPVRENWGFFILEKSQEDLFTESQNHQVWKRSLRSCSPTITPATNITTPKPYPQVPHPDTSWTLPEVVTPLTIWATYSNAWPLCQWKFFSSI